MTVFELGILPAAILEDAAVGVVSILAGMAVGLLLCLVCWHFMKKSDRETKRAFLWLFLVWGALWVGQGIRDQIQEEPITLAVLAVSALTLLGGMAVHKDIGA